MKHWACLAATENQISFSHSPPTQIGEKYGKIKGQEEHNKARRLIEESNKKEIFGQAVAYVGVVEFQKRGLPHLHLLITLDGDAKPRNPQQIDCMVSVDISHRKSTEACSDLILDFCFTFFYFSNFFPLPINAIVNLKFFFCFLLLFIAALTIRAKIRSWGEWRPLVLIKIIWLKMPYLIKK